MNEFGLTIVIAFCFCLLLIIASAIAKAFYHFNYLKKVSPDKFSKYENYFSLYLNLELFNLYRIVLLFPYFNRKRNNEVDEGAKQIGDQVVKLVYLNLLSFLLMAVYLLFIIIKFGVKPS